MSKSGLLIVGMGAALIGFGLSRVKRRDKHFLVPSAEEFIARAAVAVIYEVKAARIALTKGKDARLRAFAATMIQDHAATGNELKTVARAIQVPVSLDRVRSSLVERLNSAAPEEFDELYWRQQSEAHKDSISLFTLFATSSDNPGPLKGFAAKTLPMLQRHQEMASELKAAAVSQI